jgi:hypothetical protein
MPYGISIQLVLRGGGIKYKKKKEGVFLWLLNQTHTTHTLEGCYNHMRVGCVSDVTLKCIKWRYHFFFEGVGGFERWVGGGGGVIYFCFISRNKNKEKVLGGVEESSPTFPHARTIKRRLRELPAAPGAERVPYPSHLSPFLFFFFFFCFCFFPFYTLVYICILCVSVCVCVYSARINKPEDGRRREKKRKNKKKKKLNKINKN